MQANLQEFHNYLSRVVAASERAADSTDNPFHKGGLKAYKDCLTRFEQAMARHDEEISNSTHTHDGKAYKCRLCEIELTNDNIAWGFGTFAWRKVLYRHEPYFGKWPIIKMKEEYVCRKCKSEAKELCEDHYVFIDPELSYTDQ